MLNQVEYSTLSGSIKQRVQDLFRVDTPNRAILESFLAGAIPGKLFVDDAEKPKRATIRADFLGWTFVGGVFDPGQFVSDVKPILRLVDLSIIGNFDQIEPYAELFQVQTMPRLQFENVDFEQLLRLPSLSVPNQSIRVASPAQFDSCVWKDLMVLGYGSKESFLKHGKAFQLVVDGMCVSETYLTFSENRMCELGAITVEGERGKGYALELVRHVIESARAKSIDTVWSCDVDNHGSVALAKKLCYTSIRPYHIHYVAKLAEAAG